MTLGLAHSYYEKEQKIRQIGTTGHAVYYVLK
jgi:hypothetical protein